MIAGRMANFASVFWLLVVVISSTIFFCGYGN
jgi:hypothetical protein